MVTFGDHIRKLEKEEEEHKAKDRERERRTHRKNRDAFQVRGVKDVGIFLML